MEKTHYAKCNSHHSTTTYLPTPLVTTSTLHNTPNPFMPSPKKTPQNKLQKKHLPKSAKTSHVGMHFQQKTLPQKPTKQATMHTRRHAQPTHTSQRDAFTTYLPSLHLSNHTHHKPYHTPIRNTLQLHLQLFQTVSESFVSLANVGQVFILPTGMPGDGIADLTQHTQHIILMPCDHYTEEFYRLVIPQFSSIVVRLRIRM